MPSSNQWYPVSVTASTVHTACSAPSQRHRLREAVTAPTPTTNAHATCIDGIAASWPGLAAPALR